MVRYCIPAGLIVSEDGKVTLSKENQGPDRFSCPHLAAQWREELTNIAREWLFCYSVTLDTYALALSLSLSLSLSGGLYLLTR